MANIDTRCTDNALIIIFHDRQLVDESYCYSVGRRLMELVDDMPQSAILLNFGKVDFMASSMIGQLVKLRNKCKDGNICLRVCEINSRLLEAIQLMRLDQILNAHQSESEALLALELEH